MRASELWQLVALPTRIDRLLIWTALLIIFARQRTERFSIYRICEIHTHVSTYAMHMHTPRAPVITFFRRHFRLGRLTHWRQCGHPTLFYTSTRNPPRETNLAISHSAPSVDILTIWCDTAIICHTFQCNSYSTSSSNSSTNSSNKLSETYNLG